MQSEQELSYKWIIQETTVSTAWGMSELSNWLSSTRKRFRGKSSEKGVWYLIAPDRNLILPTAFRVDTSRKAEEYFPSIFGEVEKSIEAYLASKEGNLPNLKEYEAIAQMTLDDPAAYSNMVPWMENIPSCLRAIGKYQEAGQSEYVLYIFSPPRYMFLRNKPMMFDLQEQEPASFQTYETAVMVFESDIWNIDYNRYLHGEKTEDVIHEQEKYDKGTKIHLKDDRIKELLPVPLSFVGMGQRGRFLAYDLTIPQSISEESKRRFSLTELQDFLLCKEISENFKNLSETTIKQYIEDHAFLYSIRVDKYIIRQLNELTEGTQG